MLRKVLNPLSPVEAMELLLDKMGKTKNNAEFLSAMRKWVGSRGEPTTRSKEETDGLKATTLRSSTGIHRQSVYDCQSFTVALCRCDGSSLSYFATASIASTGDSGVSTLRSTQIG